MALSAPAHKIGPREAHRWMERYESAKNRIAKITEKAEEKIRAGTRTLEVSGAAFGIGFLQGRSGGVEVFGVPLELGLGLAGTGFALLGGAGAYGEHVHNLADGCLAAWATTMGRAVGTDLRNKAGQPASLPAGGAAAKGVRLSAEEMAEMAGIPR